MLNFVPLSYHIIYVLMPIIYSALFFVCRKGKPHLFMTTTCNPNWTEIKDELQPGQEAWMRPDITARVFKMKLDAMMKDLMKNGIMGRSIAHIQVIEFQKRGLPHAHLLIRLHNDDAPTVDMFDQFVCAEIPNKDTHPRLYAIVTSNMLHGPCDARCKAATGECDKKFPKTASDTTIAREGEYPIYRRRCQHSHVRYNRQGETISEQTDCHVVPYNIYLTLRYNAHTNMELATNISVVKYLYKYVYKGGDRAAVCVEEVAPDPAAPIVIDEIKKYVDARYLSASEAFWHLYGFPMQSCYPPVQKLQLHLEDHHRIQYQEGEEVAALNIPAHTTLTNYFAIVQAELETPLSAEVLDGNPPATALLYTEFPPYYTWNGGQGWQRRKRPKKTDTIGRMFTAHPTAGERFYLRKLLLHTPGATSYEALRIYEGVTYPTYKATCLARGLLLNDQEWKECLHEAARTLMPKPLRALFVAILVHNVPARAADLWELEVNGSPLKKCMAEDFYRTRTNRTNYSDVNDTDIAVVFHTIDDLIRDVSKNDMSIADFNLCDPAPPRPDHMGVEVDLNRLLRGELNYDADTEETTCTTNYESFNADQHAVFDTITTDCNHYDMDNSAPNTYHIFFIDAPGGTGKTYVLNTLAAHTRSVGKISLCTASSGIAAVLLKGGRTAHSQFKIPLKMLPDTECSISKRSDAGKVLIAADIIMWDEGPMMSKTIMASVNRLLQHLMNSTAYFGGKKIIFSGDFRQCLPIIPKQGRAVITSEILKECPWWPHCRQLRLSENERLKRFGVNAANTRLAEFLVKVGNGTVPHDPNVVNDCIRIPDKYVFPSDDINSFIDWVYPNLHEGHVDSSSSIIAPLNKDVDYLNSKCLERMTPGVQALLLASCDEVVVQDDPVEIQNYQEEYFNQISLAGLPPHLLELKIDTPVVLLRNLDPANGLCNGTRLQVKGITHRLLTCRVLNGPNAEAIVHIPRVDLITAEGVLPFTMRRRQFPVKVAFAMTINKAQGQSFSTVGTYLSRPVFGHGQLYVALSRAGVAERTTLFIVNVPNIQGKFHGHEGTYTKNIVYGEVLTAR